MSTFLQALVPFAACAGLIALLLRKPTSDEKFAAKNRCPR